MSAWHDSISNDRDHNPPDLDTDSHQLRFPCGPPKSQSHQSHDDDDERGSENDELEQVSRSVIEDFSELFLTVPPPQPPPPPPSPSPPPQPEQQDGEDGDCAVGITDEVFTFATNIAMHPETWLDFPLDPDDDLDDFELSIGQHEHALAITQLSPRLNALRIELCPCHMTESYFWKVASNSEFVENEFYYSLTTQSLELSLTMSKVMEARALWMQELQKLTKPETDWCGRFQDNASELHEDSHSPLSYASSRSFSPRVYGSEPSSSTMAVEHETEKNLVEAQLVDKSVIEERPPTKTEDRDIHVLPYSKISIPHFEDDDDDDWPEEDSDLGDYTGNIVCNDEDFSFSDLEADDDDLRFKSKTSGVKNDYWVRIVLKAFVDLKTYRSRVVNYPSHADIFFEPD
ncbi:hypothetical protein ACFE04_004485 [Oxalis oulophora]